MSAAADGGFATSITLAELERDPYPIYARLRAEAPVAWVPATGMWLATRWEEALRVASEPERFGADMPGSPIDRSFGEPTILTCDGETHRSLRAGVDPSLRPRQVEGYIDELIGPIASRLLDRIVPRGESELMSEYLEPVSVLGLGALLGLDDLDADTLRGWFAGLAEGATNFGSDPDRQRRSDAICAEIDATVGPRLERLAAEPDGSLLSQMLHGGLPDGRCRSPQMVMPSLKVILLGGMQEPGHGAGSVLFGLLSHPDQRAEVAADPERLLGAAIEEGMRWVSPIGTQGRRVKEPLELGGAELPAGAPVAAVIASANRDEARFPAPEVFDIHRDRQRTASFGFGPHFCSGHAFARALERIALRHLLQRCPRIALDPSRAPSFSGWEFRAPGTLHARWG